MQAHRVSGPAQDPQGGGQSLAAGWRSGELGLWAHFSHAPSPVPPQPLPLPVATLSPLVDRAPPRRILMPWRVGGTQAQGGPASGHGVWGGGGLTADSLNGHVSLAAERRPATSSYAARWMSSCLRPRAARGQPSWAGRPGSRRGRAAGRQSREAERCNERRRLDLWGCARAPGLPARASPIGNKNKSWPRHGTTGS